MKYTILTLLLTTNIYSQVGINTTKPDASAILHVESTDEGVIFPRIQLQNVTSFAPLKQAPPENTIVFNPKPAGTGANKLLKGYYIWNKNNWSSPAINTPTKIIAKFEAYAENTFNFNTSPTGKNVKVFNTEIFNTDVEYDTFSVVNSEELKILKKGTYLVTTNLSLKNTTASASQAEIYFAYYYGDQIVSSKLLTQVPQQRGVGSNVGNLFNYSLIDYVNIETPGETLKLKAFQNYPRDTDFVTYDINNFSSITIVKISDLY